MNSDQVLEIVNEQKRKRRDAKKWLRRVYYQTLRVEAEERALRVIEQRVNNAVGKMESDGASVDRSQSSRRREAALVDYAQKNEEFEIEAMKLAKVKHETMALISKIGDERLEKIAERRYVDCLSWRDVEKIEAFSHAHMMRLHIDILNKTAAILERLPKKKEVQL